MPAEPERHVEKLLRAYSKRRREEAARIPELHPATRQMLRDEAARTWRPGTAEAEVGEKFGGSLWLRLGFAGAVGAVIVAAAVFMRPGKEGFDLAKNEKPRGMAPASEPASADRLTEARQNTPAPPAAPAATKPPENKELSGREMLRTRDAASSARRADTPKLAVTATSSDRTATLTVTVADTGGVAGKDLADWRTQLRFSEPAERKLLASYEGSAGVSRNRPPEFVTRPEPLYGLYTELQSASVQFAESSQTTKSIEEMTRQLVAAARVQRAGDDQKKLDQQPLAQQSSQRARFRQSAVVAEQPQVMNSFVIEQTGRQIRIIEDDGSVYEGQITGAPIPARVEPAKVEKAVEAERVMKAKSAVTLSDQAAPAAASTAMETVSFVALGFNRTLGQAVVFRGNFESAAAPGGQAQAEGAKLGQTQVQRLEAAVPANQSGVGGARSNAVLYFGGGFTEASAVGQAQTQGGSAVSGIRGKVTVGGAVEVEIRAVPEKP
ncbi:MAG: hypothetical protein HZA89_09570 [Verrucomicrobia bacterium]|nr:hypothetical protein [Verrucomicrobiota bacterium]